jgi:hypothetical protein
MTRKLSHHSVAFVSSFLVVGEEIIVRDERIKIQKLKSLLWPGSSNEVLPTDNNILHQDVHGDITGVVRKSGHMGTEVNQLFAIGR